MSIGEIEDKHSWFFYCVVLPYSVFILHLCLLCLCGCVAVKYEHPDYGKLEYNRKWTQEIESVEIIINGNPPIELRLNGQKAEMPEVDKIAGAIAAGLVP